MLAEKPFPWKCVECHKRAAFPAVVSYQTEIEHDGRVHVVHVPDLRAPRCQECGALVFDEQSSQQVTDALVRHLGLLSGAQIRVNRERLGITQERLARELGVAERMVARWEMGGQIPSRAVDRLLRLYFSLPAVRETLMDEAGMLKLGAIETTTVS